MFNINSDLFNKALYTALADKLALVFNEVLCLAAEDAVGLMLLEDDAVALYIDFNGVLFGQIEGSSHFNGQNDSSKLVELTNDTGGFHMFLPPETMCVYGGHTGNPHTPNIIYSQKIIAETP